MSHLDDRLDKAKLCKVLGLLTSSHEGERAAAALKASEMLRAAGLSWSELLTPNGKAAPEPPPRAEPRRPRETIVLGGKPYDAEAVLNMTMSAAQALCRSLDDFQRLGVLRNYKSGWSFYSWRASPHNPARG